MNEHELFNVVLALAGVFSAGFLAGVCACDATHSDRDADYEEE